MLLKMDRKKVFLLLISFALLIGLFPHTAYAAEGDAGLGSAFDSIRQLFAFLPELITM